MKQYLGYSETSYFASWPYYKKNKDKTRKKLSGYDSGRFDCRYVGFCTKKDMIEIVGRDIVHSMNWVKERTSRTGNDLDIELCKKYPGCIIVYDHTYGSDNEVIEVINIKERRAKIEAERLVYI